MNLVYEVRTVERTERRYLVEFTKQDVADDIGLPVKQVDDEDCRTYAEERVRSGEDIKFTEGNADIEEVLNVRLQD